MRRRLLPAMGASLALTGCQPPTYDIIAVLRGDHVVLVAQGSGSSGEEDIFATWLQVRDGRQIVWRIQSDPDRPNCRPAGPTPPFPLVYGRVPACFIEVVRAQTLRDGAVYLVNGGSDLRDGYGYFQIERAARNLTREEADEQTKGWTQIATPSYRGPSAGQRKANTSAAPPAADNVATSQ